jgi:hypothetical protein
MAVHAPTSDIGEAGLDLLANVDAVHEVIPSGGLRKAPNELNGFGLNALTLGLVIDEPRAARHKPFSWNEKARWSELALRKIAGQPRSLAPAPCSAA